MTERYLSIIEIDHDTEKMIVIHNYGPCEQHEYERRMAHLVQAEVDWDTVLNCLLAELANKGFVTADGIEKGFTIGSVLQLIHVNAVVALAPDLPLPGEKKKTMSLENRLLLQALAGTLKFVPMGKVIDFKKEDLDRLNEIIGPVFTRQLLYDVGRRDFLRSLMPLTVAEYESERYGSEQKLLEE